MLQVNTPYPTAILIREKAMVLNIESIRMIICRDYVYILSVPDPTNPVHGRFPAHDCDFVHEVVRRLTTDSHAAPAPQRCHTMPRASLNMLWCLFKVLRELDIIRGQGRWSLLSNWAMIRTCAVPCLASEGKV